MSKRAIILVGGKGTRLHPYTVVLPKPLMPIGEFPILEVIVRQLVAAGFDYITMAVNHQAEIIKAFFQEGEKWGIRIDYSLEHEPLGTMGPLRLINNLPEHFLVMNGDILTDLDFSCFYQRHVENNEIFSISSYIRKQEIDYGVLDTNVDGNLTGFREKPKYDYEVSMGVYMVSIEALKNIPEDKPYGFDSLMLEFLQRNINVNVSRFNGYWLDIGRPDDYEKAIEEFEEMRCRFLND